MEDLKGKRYAFLLSPTPYMTKLSAAPPVARLLSLRDTHGALLVEFDYHLELDLLHVRWYGHLTADTLVYGATEGLKLFAGERFPLRLYSDHLLVTGEWAEALPWLQYEWLPKICARGVQTLAHVPPKGSTNLVATYHGGPEFITAVGQALRTQSFRHPELAWHWLVRH